MNPEDRQALEAIENLYKRPAHVVTPLAGAHMIWVRDVWGGHYVNPVWLSGVQRLGLDPRPVIEQAERTLRDAWQWD